MRRATQAEVAAASFDPLVRYQQRPVPFVHEVLGQFPWRDQRAVLEAAVDDPLLAVRSGKGVGKTRLLAWLMLWNFYCWRNSLGITTATTWTQVKNQLWREIHLMLERARVRLPGRRLETRLELGPKWYMLGLSTRKPESMAGFHADTGLDASRFPAEVLAAMSDEDFFGQVAAQLAPDVPLLGAGIAASEARTHAADAGSRSASSPIVPPTAEHGHLFAGVDEASGVDPRIDDAVDGLATTPGSRLYRFGNPTRLAGRFFVIFNPSAAGEVHRPGEHIAGRDVRCFTIDARRAPAAIVDPHHLARMAVRFGPEPESHPTYQVEVMGIHPTSTRMSYVTDALLQRATRARPGLTGVHLGVDIARHGRDPCLAVLVDHGVVCGRHRWAAGSGPVVDLVASACVIRDLQQAWGVADHDTHVDATGMGWGVVDELARMAIHVDPVDFGGAVLGDWFSILGHAPNFKNRKHELFWVVLRCLEEGQLCIPSDPRYHGIWSDGINLQLADPKRLREGEWSMEPKEDFIARVGRSSDDWDALVCAHSRPMLISPGFG